MTTSLDATPTLPDWPPPDREPIGVERAGAYIVWIRQHAEALVSAYVNILDQ